MRIVTTWVGKALPLTGGTMSGNIAMGGNKVTGLGAASAAGQALRYEQLIDLYLLLTGGTLSGDLSIGANKLKTTSCLLKEIATGHLAVRNLADDDYYHLRTAELWVNTGIYALANAVALATTNANDYYIAMFARDTGVNLAEVARLVGAADPYFQATLPMVLKPATWPATPVEGHFGYVAADDRLKYQDAAGLKVIPQLVVAETEVFNGTSPTSFTDLDLSGTIGAQATLVLLKICDAAGSNYFAVRKNGDADQFYHAGSHSAAMGWDAFGGIHIVLIVATDTSGIIEWRSATARTCTIDVIAYIK